MPLLYTLSLLYAVRLTILFAVMKSVHAFPKLSFIPLLPLSLSIVFLAFIVEKEKSPRGISGVSCEEHLKLASSVLNQFSEVDLMNRSLIKRRRIVKNFLISVGYA